MEFIMKCEKEMMLLYAVTDRMWTGAKTLMEQVEEALKGGVTCVQLREKELEEKDFLEEAYRIKEICKKYKVPFIINDNVDVMICCQADGIHVGQSDMKARQVRNLVGEDKILGVSVQTVEEAIEAKQAGADYLGVGAMFPTSTKPDAQDVSYETLKEICEAVDIPVVAIGGINKENIEKLSGTKVDGVALVSAIFAADNIEMECKELRSISSKMVLSKKEKGD